MRKIVLSLASAVVFASAAFAADKAVVSDDLLKASLQVCQGQPTFTREPMTQPLPQGFKGEYVTVKSDSISCAGQYAAVITPAGEYFVGIPWPLAGISGTPAEKLRQFGRDRLNQSFTAEIDSLRSKSGLYHVILKQKTEFGDIPIEGWIDSQGTMFFAGSFHDPSDDVMKARLAEIQKATTLAPTKGPADAPVWVIEFSDFQCPSCKRAAGFFKPILAKYGDRIRYTRVDLPLVSSHPWAFAAALAGRAIYRQSPEAFWQYKDAVYEMQDDLSIFTLEDFVKGFVKDHDLDLDKYQKDVESQALRDEILASVGTAFSQQIFGTPTYLVNGVMVDAETNGSGLETYIGKLLAAK